MISKKQILEEVKDLRKEVKIMRMIINSIAKS